MKIGEINEDTYHVTLLAIVILVAVSVYDIIASILHACCDVIEVCYVGRVRQNFIPSYALDRLLADRSVIKSVYSFLVGKAEVVLFFQVSALLDKPVSITESQNIKEVG